MKLILLILVLLNFEAGGTITCRRAEGVDDESLDSPELAKTISIGMLIEENSKLIYISKEPWAPLRLEVSKDKCDGFNNKKKNEIMLLTSQKNIQELQGQTLNLTNSRLRNLDDVGAFAETISRQRDEFPLGEPNMFWKYCFSDLFCTKVKGICGNSVGINKQFQTRYENYLKSHQDKVKCEKNIVNENKKSQCIQNFCN